MKVYKYALPGAGILLSAAGCILAFTQIPESVGRAVLLIILLLFGILDMGYYAEPPVRKQQGEGESTEDNLGYRTSGKDTVNQHPHVSRYALRSGYRRE